VVGSEPAWNIARKAATTLPKEDYYFNLLLVDNPQYNKLVQRINPSHPDISGSHDIVAQLVELAQGEGYSMESTIAFLNEERRTRRQNIEQFARFLLTHAKGNLKSELLMISHTPDQVHSIGSIINNLLSQAKYEKYTRDDVYSLLLNRIDAQGVEEFILLLEEVAPEHIKKALSTLDAKDYSNPLEIVRRLIAISDEYGYSEQDVHQMLIELILRDTEGKALMAGTPHDVAQWDKRKKLINTLILVNVIIIILIVLFIFRRKNKSRKP
jgi:hypothetical protein